MTAATHKPVLYTKTASKSKGPEQVTDEFSSHDPDRCGRASDQGSADYYDHDSREGGGGGWVLF